MLVIKMGVEKVYTKLNYTFQAAAKSRKYINVAIFYSKTFIVFGQMLLKILT